MSRVPDPQHAEAALVRPYTVTGGRTRSSSLALPLEALVESTAGADSRPSGPEKRRILQLTASEYLSVAELSAHLGLPVGVVRVLVGDLSDEGSVRVHGLSSQSSYPPATSLSVLESVLDGIASL